MKVYRYGLLPPIENAELVRREMLAAHRYRNSLVAIEKARRVVIRDIISSGGAAAAEATVATAEAAVLAAVQHAKAQRIATRSRVLDAASKSAITQARAAKKTAVANLYSVRLALKTSLADARDDVEERVAEMRRGARALCGCYWGSYLLVEDADRAMRALPLYDKEEPNDPRFVNWRGDGRIGVQIQGGITAKAIMDAKDTRLRIEPDAPAKKADPQSKRSAKNLRTILAVRVGSNDDRSPIWARFPMVMHRMMPTEGIIKRAVVHRRMVGPTEEWYVTITVDDGAHRVSPTANGAVVGVDIGWRQMPNGSLRVGTWYGSDGQSGFIETPARALTRMQKVRDLESIRDKNFNTARAQLVEWLAASTSDLPQWLVGATQTLAQWKSIRRLIALVQRWKTRRFSDDGQIYTAMEAWRYNDHHLWQWECHQRLSTQRFRKEEYRVLAAELKKRYEVVAFEDLDLRPLARVAKLDSEEKGTDAEQIQRYNRRVAAPSELRGVLVNAFGGLGGGRITWHPPEYTTVSCYACGHIDTWDQAQEMEHTCSACKLSWDQDDNAARNLVQMSLCERAHGAGKAAPSRNSKKANKNNDVQESRWTKAKRMRAEKDARMLAARNGEGNVAESQAT